MSARSVLIQELDRQPEGVAQKLLDYLHALVPPSGQPTGGQTGHFASHWGRYYGALEGQEWDEPAELPAEKREEW